MANGGRGTYGSFGSGCHHSQCVESWFQNVPGLKIVAPYYPADVKGLLKASIRDDDPVVFLFHEGSVGVTGEVPDGDVVIPLTNAANVLREGEDVTIVAIQSMVPIAMKAAETLAAEGISAEVIDPRVLIPLDIDKITESVRKTGRCVVVSQCVDIGSFTGEVVSQVVANCFDDLDAPVLKVGAKNGIAPQAVTLEKVFLPTADDIAAAVKATL